MLGLGCYWVGVLGLGVRVRVLLSLGGVTVLLFSGETISQGR